MRVESVVVLFREFFVIWTLIFLTERLRFGISCRTSFSNVVFYHELQFLAPKSSDRITSYTTGRFSGFCVRFD